MRVASKLRLAFAAYIALLAGLSLYHVRAIQRTVDSAHQLSAISAQLGAAASAQRMRIDEVTSSAEKVAATRDRMAEASHAAMTRELAESERAAGAAERVSWLAAAGALLFAMLMVRRIEELDRMKREFVSNVSHDLKTPLSSMQETTEVLLDELPGPLSRQQRSLLLLNRESARRLSSMIAKLLDLSRLESRMTRNFEALDVTRLVRTVVARANATRTRPVATIDAPQHALTLRADVDGISQLLDNLLENAIKFSPSGGVVRVTIAEVDGALHLTVADDGPGIPDAEKKRVFERFHQTDTGRSAQSRGVGLGLSICRHIVSAHSGRIWVADNSPRGSVFHVLLPGLIVAAEGSSERAA
jgi:signal transduction histidine kinase